MKNLPKKTLAACIMAIACCILTTGYASAAEFSATMKQTIADGKQSMSMQGKIYIKGVMQRQEFGNSNSKRVIIVRPDKGVVWQLMPSDKSYREQPIPKQTTQPPIDSIIKKAPGAKKIGTTKIGNYQCDKYQYTDKEKKVTGVICVSPKLNHELKSVITTPRGKVTTELVDIKEGKLAQSLFEIPKGYKQVKSLGKMALPSKGASDKGTPPSPPKK